MYTGYIYPELRKAAKKGIFLVSRPLKPYLPPLELNGNKIFWIFFSRALKKSLFSAPASTTPTPPLRGWAPKKNFFAASLNLFAS